MFIARALTVMKSWVIIEIDLKYLVSVPCKRNDCVGHLSLYRQFIWNSWWVFIARGLTVMKIWVIIEIDLKYLLSVPCKRTHCDEEFSDLAGTKIFSLSESSLACHYLILTMLRPYYLHHLASKVYMKWSTGACPFCRVWAGVSSMGFFKGENFYLILWRIGNTFLGLIFQYFHDF